MVVSVNEIEIKSESIPESIPITNNNTSIVKSNKKTPEQIKEASRIKKQKQREALRTRLGDEEYKKEHAKKIAKDRAKKK
jgi:NCAIR mutase (PurE)-related protein